MWVFLAFLALLAVIIVLMMKIDTLAREHKRFIVQCRLMESESSHVQHITFDMAEEFSVNLQQQLQLARRTTRVTEAEVLLFEFCIQSIPAVQRIKPSSAKFGASHGTCGPIKWHYRYAAVGYLYQSSWPVDSGVAAQ